MHRYFTWPTESLRCSILKHEKKKFGDIVRIKNIAHTMYTKVGKYGYHEHGSQVQSLPSLHAEFHRQQSSFHVLHTSFTNQNNQ
jgi:hypothetical protein